MIYTHVLRTGGSGMKSPLDCLERPPGFLDFSSFFIWTLLRAGKPALRRCARPAVG